MKYKNYKFIVFALCLYIEQSLQASSTPSSYKIYVINEDEADEHDNHEIKSNQSSDTKETSGKNSVASMNELQQIFKTDDIHSLIRLLAEDLNQDDQQDDLIIPFYVTDNKKDLIALNKDVPYGCYQYLIAAGGGLTTNEYKIMHTILSESLTNNKNFEDEIRSLFVEALEKGDLGMVKSLFDIDTCVRYQNYLNPKFLEDENRLKHGPLLTTTFDDGKTCLHYAVMSNNVDVVNFLIENSALLNSPCNRTSSSKEFYRPQTPLDFAFVYREQLKNNDETAAIEFDKNAKIIDLFIKSYVPLHSSDPNIQSLIRAYMTDKIKSPTMQKKLTIYESIRNLLSKKSSTIHP